MSTNSKVTRVQPVFAWLNEQGGKNWPTRLLSMASGITLPVNIGTLERVELDPERKVAASAARLAWMIRNVSRLAPTDGRKWRKLLERTSNAAEVKAALTRLDHGDTSGLGKLRLEGITHADCLIECERGLIWIEGKRFDWISPSIKWDISRDQLARNLEAVWLLAKNAGKDYCLVICHEHPLKHHEQALLDGYRKCTCAAGWPHISADQRTEFSNRIGTLTWHKIGDAWPDLRSLPQLHDLPSESDNGEADPNS